MALVGLVGCGSGEIAPEALDRPAPRPAPSVPPRPTTFEQTGLRVVPVMVGDTTIEAEVADTPQTRSDGLRGRDGVPPGTGMVFRFDGEGRQRFTMSGVTYPLVAVFALRGTVVAVEQMVPCAGTIAECPTYGPDGVVDTVLEAAPESLPDAARGDVFVDN